MLLTYLCLFLSLASPLIPSSVFSTSIEASSSASVGSIDSLALDLKDWIANEKRIFPNYDYQLFYTYNPYVPLDLWLELEPYFLPIHHPVKYKLDRLFRDTRVIKSQETFKAAGFRITRPHRPFNANVSGHTSIQGYLVKVYLDSQQAVSDWEMWLRRIRGVEVIQKCLKKHGFTQFVVPKKWIYPLPPEPSPPLSSEYSRKNFILVVEDMDILKGKKNAQAYREQMTKKLLNDLYTVMLECQLTDCVYIGNMPFTKSGKIAFIDTELYLQNNPNFESLKQYLSIPMQAHLDKLMHENSL